MIRKGRLKVATLAMAMTALGISGSALAGGHGDRGGMKRAQADGERGQLRHRKARQAGPMGTLRGLDLSAEQRSQLRAIMQDAREDAAESRAAMRELQRAVREATQAGGGFDEAQARILVESRAQLLVDNTVRRLRTQAAIEAVLNEEQRAQLGERRQRRSAR